MAVKFDHTRLHQRLYEAAQIFRGDGRDYYAVAVEQARSILIDEICRIAEARRVAQTLRRLGEGKEPVSADAVRQLAHTMEQYVTHAHGPWIGTPLFPPDWPDGHRED